MAIETIVTKEDSRLATKKSRSFLSFKSDLILRAAGLLLRVVMALQMIFRSVRRGRN